MIKIFHIFCISLIMASNQTWGQRLDFTHLSVENGLSNKSVLSIAQDSRGFLWFGTANGLNRYDSQTFKTYLVNSGANSDLTGYIISLFSDSQNTFWVGTSKGLGIYRPRTDDIVQVPLTKGADGLTTHVIKCITEDKNHRIFIGTNSGLFILSVKNHQIVGFYKAGANQLASDEIHSIVDDWQGNIWIGTNKGVTKMHPNGKTFVFETFHHSNRLGSLSDENITSIAEDKNHTLWIGSREKGLDCYDASKKIFINYNNPFETTGDAGNIRQIIANDNKLFIGTQDGLNTFDITTHQFTNFKHNPDNPKSLNQNSIYSLLYDKDNTLWVGTYFGGVNIAVSSSFNVYQANNGSSSIDNNVISAIVNDKDSNLWIGTEGGGLNYIRLKDKKVFKYEHQKNNLTSISSNLIKTVYKDHDQNIWIGTHEGGLNVMTPGLNNFTKYLYNKNNASQYNLEVRAIVEDTGRNFWAGTNIGLKAYKRTGILLTPSLNTANINALKTQPINCLYIDSKNILWAGSWGLFALDKIDKKTNSFNRIEPLYNYRVNCITEDSNNNMWIGTDNHGLYKYNKANRTTTNYTENNGLANNSVYGLVKDLKNNIWIGTANGLSYLNTETGIFHNYTVNDGLAGNEFNKNSCTTFTNGEIFFGGFNGITFFNPATIKANINKPEAFITGIKLFNKTVSVGDSSGILRGDISTIENVTLKYTQNVFTIDFVILNFIRAEKNKYAYRIQNIDKNWNYTTIPSATYNNLPPGQYRFLARGQNNDGIWSATASLLIVVQPPWWRTWWMYFLYLLGIVGIVFLIVRFFFIRALLKRDQELTALKLNFFTNISHEIRTNLSLISGPVEKLLMHHTILSDDTHQLQTIKKNSDELLQLVNELMDFRRAETGNLSLHASRFNIVPFIEAICESFRDFAVEKNILTDFQTSAKEIELYFDKEQMRKVMINLLSNAYKFTPSGGRVSLYIQENDDHVNISVADNGKTISPENINKLFNNYFQENDYGQQNNGYGIGLALSKSIVALHKGDISVDSHKPIDDNDMSTTFTVRLRKGSRHLMPNQLVELKPIAQVPLIADIDDEYLGLSVTNSVLVSVNKKYTILLVDDNPEVRKFISSSLHHTYIILEADNGKKGFEIATEQIPDVIISDVMMPEMDGYAFCKTIKMDERTNHIPVILLTAKASVSNQIVGLTEGADIYLTKPFSIQVLILQVHNLIDSIEKNRKRYNIGLASLNSENKVTRENEFITKIIALAEANISNPDFDIDLICKSIGMSRSVFYRKFNALTELTLNDILKEIRLKKAAELLLEKKHTIYEIGNLVCYYDTKYFSREFKKRFGVPPRDYKSKT